jgi:membrane protein implicated in regulation of membrane protease activity
MDSLYRRVLWGLGALLVCALILWLIRWRGRGGKIESGGALASPGKRERLVLTEDIRVGQTGSVSYRGSVWSARNESGRDLKEGEQVFVERVEPTHTLVVTAAGGVVESVT